MNLLSIVQRVLSSIDSENVTAISDTVEAQDVVDIINHVYQEILGHYDWPFLKTSSYLEVTSTDNQMKVPDTIYGISNIWYDNKEITFMDYPSFQTMLLNRIEAEEGNIDSNGSYTDREPIYWSTVDDSHVIFDSYDEELLQSLSKVYGSYLAEDMIEDTEEPVIPRKYHYVLLEGSLARAAYSLKGDDSLGDRHYKVYSRGLQTMESWAKNLVPKHSTNNNINYGRKV